MGQCSEQNKMKPNKLKKMKLNKKPQYQSVNLIIFMGGTQLQTFS